MKERIAPMRFRTQVGEYQIAAWMGTNESGWEPILDKVIVYPDQAPTETEGGIKLTTDMTDRHTMAAEAGVVVAIGPDVTIGVKPGDRVFIERFAGQLAPGHDRKIYRIIDQSSIGAVFKPSVIQKVRGLRS